MRQTIAKSDWLIAGQCLSMRSEIGEDLFDNLIGECTAALGVAKRTHAAKNSPDVAEVIERAWPQGSNSRTLEHAATSILEPFRNG